MAAVDRAETSQRREDTVTAVLPAAPRFAVVVRTTAAACASVEGFSIDEVADVSLLVHEVFVELARLGGREVEVRLQPGDGRIDLHMTTARTSGPDGPEGWTGANVDMLSAVANVVAESSSFESTPHHLVFRATLRARG